MAEYHVKLDSDGNIVAGTLSKTGKFINKSVVTQEALDAVRDHLLYETKKQNKDIAFGWNYPNGKTLFIRLEEKDTQMIKEEE